MERSPQVFPFSILHSQFSILKLSLPPLLLTVNRNACKLAVLNINRRVGT